MISNCEEEPDLGYFFGDILERVNNNDKSVRNDIKDL